MPRYINKPAGQDVEQEDTFLSGVVQSAKTRGKQLVGAMGKDYSLGERAIQRPGLRGAGAIGGFISDVAGEAISHGAKALDEATGNVASGSAKAIGRGIAQYTPDVIKDLGKQALQSGMQAWSQFEKEFPEYAQDVKDIANVGSAIGTVKAGTAMAKAGAQTIKKTSAVTGRAMQKLGDDMFTTVLPMNDMEAKAMQNYWAKNTLPQRVKGAITGTSQPKPLTAARSALEEGLYGTETQIGVQANRIANELKSKIDPILANTNKSVIKSKIFADAHRFIDSIEEPTTKAAYQEAMDDIVREYANYPEYINPLKAQKLKTEINTFTPKATFTKGKPISNEYKALKSAMANSIKNQTYDMMDYGKEAYLKWSNMMDLMELGIKDSSGRNTIFGANVWGRFLDKTVTPIGTAGGQMLYSLGGMLQFKGRPGLKKFGDLIRETFDTSPLLLEDVATKVRRGGAVIEGQAPKFVPSNVPGYEAEAMMQQLRNYVPSDVRQHLQSLQKSSQAQQIMNEMKGYQPTNVPATVKKATTKILPVPGQKPGAIDLRKLQ